MTKVKLKENALSDLCVSKDIPRTNQIKFWQTLLSVKKHEVFILKFTSAVRKVNDNLRMQYKMQESLELQKCL